MPDYLTHSQIARLCDIGELHLPKLTGDQKRDLERLISAGFRQTHTFEREICFRTPICSLPPRGNGKSE